MDKNAVAGIASGQTAEESGNAAAQNQGVNNGSPQANGDRNTPSSGVKPEDVRQFILELQKKPDEFMKWQEELGLRIPLSRLKEVGAKMGEWQRRALETEKMLADYKKQVEQEYKPILQKANSFDEVSRIYSWLQHRDQEVFNALNQYMDEFYRQGANGVAQRNYSDFGSRANDPDWQEIKEFIKEEKKAREQKRLSAEEAENERSYKEKREALFNEANVPPELHELMDTMLILASHHDKNWKDNIDTIFHNGWATFKKGIDNYVNRVVNEKMKNIVHERSLSSAPRTSDMGAGIKSSTPKTYKTFDELVSATIERLKNSS